MEISYRGFSLLYGTHQQGILMFAENQSQLGTLRDFEHVRQ
jgi:hypothetical protein